MNDLVPWMDRLVYWYPMMAEITKIHKLVTVKFNAIHRHLLDEEMKEIVLKVVKRCVASSPTNGCLADVIFSSTLLLERCPMSSDVKISSKILNVSSCLVWLSSASTLQTLATHGGGVQRCKCTADRG